MHAHMTRMRAAENSASVPGAALAVFSFVPVESETVGVTQVGKAVSRYSAVVVFFFEAGSLQPKLPQTCIVEAEPELLIPSFTSQVQVQANMPVSDPAQGAEAEGSRVPGRLVCYGELSQKERGGG